MMSELARLYQLELALKYGVSVSTVQNIVRVYRNLAPELTNTKK
jgi:hypothetical protein